MLILIYLAFYCGFTLGFNQIHHKDVWTASSSRSNGGGGGSRLLNQDISGVSSNGNGNGNGKNKGRFFGFKPLSLIQFPNKSIVCNDGSAAGYYLRKSPHKNNKIWILFLEGGWYCYDEMSCHHRWIRGPRGLMSSMDWNDKKYIGGILSPDPKENPYWWHANHIYAPYCSSDIWTGTNFNATGFSFMGALIIDEIVRSIIKLGFRNSNTLILAGSSAGGTGALLNVDRVDNLLSEEFGGGLGRVRGITDGGWFFEMPFFEDLNCIKEKDLCPPEKSLEKGIRTWNARIPNDCLYSNENLNKPWNCFFGYKIYPSIRAPIFVFQWLFDEELISALTLKKLTYLKKSEWDIIYQLGDQLKKTLKNVTSLMVPSCISHTTLTNPHWTRVQVNNVHLPKALKCWESGGIIEESNFLPNSRAALNWYQRDSSLSLSGINTNDPRRRHDYENSHRIRRRHRRKRKKRRRQLRKQNKTLLYKDNENSKRSRRRRRQKRKELFTLCDNNNDLLIDKCNWPMCNKSCPKLLNPQTGEEVDFKDLLISFGVDMGTVAKAIGIDLATLNSMEHQVLLQMLTHHS